MTNVELLIDNAMDAFWQVVADHFPQATTGDLSPLTTIQFSDAAKAAVEEWIDNNVRTQQSDVVVGYRFRLSLWFHRFPDAQIPESRTGIVTAVNDNGVWARMDQDNGAAEQRENLIHWKKLAEFADDTLPD